MRAHKNVINYLRKKLQDPPVVWTLRNDFISVSLAVSASSFWPLASFCYLNADIFVSGAKSIPLSRKVTIHCEVCGHMCGLVYCDVYISVSEMSTDTQIGEKKRKKSNFSRLVFYMVSIVLDSLFPLEYVFWALFLQLNIVVSIVW